MRTFLKPTCVKRSTKTPRNKVHDWSKELTLTPFLHCALVDIDTSSGPGMTECYVPSFAPQWLAHLSTELLLLQTHTQREGYISTLAIISPHISEASSPVMSKIIHDRIFKKTVRP